MIDGGHLLLQEILSQLKTVSSENKDITKQLAQNSLLTSQTMLDIEDIKKRLSEKEKEKTEIKGFAKYTKLLYPVIAFLMGFFYKQK